MLESFGSRVEATIPNGLDTILFRTVTPPATRRPVIGFCSRSEPHKGVGLLLESLAYVHTVRPDVKIHCFGGFRDPRLPTWVEHLGYLTDDELVSFYNECSIFVLPSRAEGWGLPAAEAMACGAALVTTANGGVDDFTDDGRTALVIPPDDLDALTKSILTLLENDTLRCRIADSASERTTSMSWDESTRLLTSVIDALVERG
jgi:glycosyltransferase involved in cell wall biosynthesis